ncbi:MAG: CpXC domain-containing protein [Chloroflexota bacterium]
MPPTKTPVNCPNCRQPILANIDRLFDVGKDPGSKRRLLSGQANQVQCPHCGFRGMVATPIVYHDPSKELLLTFTPAELSLSREEQERMTGQIINQIVNDLPQELRKGYLLNPQAVLTYKGLIERVLQSDGITPEMIEAQQKRLALIQRLIEASQEERADIAKQEDELVDAEFFTLLSYMTQSMKSHGNEQQSSQLDELYQQLLTTTTFGKELKTQAEEVEAAIKSLKEAGEGLSREKLLELVIEAPNEARLSALVSLARQGMDYIFFQQLTERINQAKGEKKEQLTTLRGRLLELTSEIDKHVQARTEKAYQMLNELLKAEDLPQAVGHALPEIDDFFIQVLSSELESAQKRGEKERENTLNKILEELEKYAAPPPEIALIEKLLVEVDESKRRKILEEHSDKVTPNFIAAISGLLHEAKQSKNEELVQRISALYLQTVRFDIARTVE